MLSVFDEPDLRNWIPIHEPSELVGEVQVYALVAGVRFLNINTWQYWRGRHPPFFPTTNLLVKDGTLGHDERCWFYENAGRRLFEGFDWRIGSLERTREDEFALTGQYCLCDPRWLDSYLRESGLRLAHVLRVSVKRIRQSNAPVIEEWRRGLLGT